MKKYIFPFLISLSALSLAGVGAFFSVTGLSKLFGGAPTAVIVMASVLEFSKVITASLLHRYWNVFKIWYKAFLMFVVAVVMIITSAGIYGFLSNAYATTSGKLQNIDAQVQMVEQKKSIVNSEIIRLQENKAIKSDRIKSLTTLRSQQESRVDSLYNRKQGASAKRVEIQIEQANNEMSKSSIEIDTLNNRIQKQYTEISALDMEIMNIKNNDVSKEVGPLKYIAKLTGKDMDSVVNFFMMLLIFVFDPLAIALVIAMNIVFKRELGSEIDKPSELVSDAVNDVVIENVSESVSEPVENTEKEIQNIENNNEMSEEEQGKKLAEVVQYVADEKGEFKPVVVDESKNRMDNFILEKTKEQGIKHNASYLKFLDILFKNGNAKTGDLLTKYDKFLEEIKEAGISCTEKEIKDFLIICNLFKITDMSDPDKKQMYKIAKDYSVAKEIISLLSK